MNKLGGYSEFGRDIIEKIDTVLATDPFGIGEHLTDAEVDDLMREDIPFSPIAAQSAELWESDGSHNDDPALVGGYGR